MRAQQHFQATIEGIRSEGLRRLAPRLRSYRGCAPTAPAARCLPACVR